MGTSFVGTPGLRAAGRYERPRELVNPKITSSRTEDSEDHGFAG